MAGGTNFESIDHARLKAMIEQSDPSKVSIHGVSISMAATALADISDELASHLTRLEWEGEAADAFRQFATKVHQTAGAISEYSRATGDVVSQVGQALFDAKNGLPAVPKDDIEAVSRHKGQPNTTVKAAGGMLGAAFGVVGVGVGVAAADKVADKLDPNWVTDSEAKAAQKRVEVAHQQAIHEMERLAQTYSMATTQLNALEAPVVGPQPGKLDQDGSVDVPIDGGGGSGGSSGTGRIGGGSGGSGYGGGSLGSGGGGGGGGGGVGSTPTPYQPTPPRPTTPWQPDPVQPWTPPSTPPRTVDPGFEVPPGTGTLPSRTGIDSLPTYPDTTNPTNTGYTPGGGTGGSTGPGGGVGGGTHAGGGGIGGGYVPSGGFGGGRGTSSLGGGSIPGRTGTTGAGGTGGGVAGRSGTAGGSGAGSGAFGAKEGQAGRAAGAGGTGAGGMHGGGGGGAGGGGAAGGSRGRGLTSTAGGTVGGRKGPGTAGEFTAGGTGLRNRAAAAGGAGGAAGTTGGTGRGAQGGMMGGQGGAGKSERERRNRADYLHEDEETWTNGTPQSNPNVIE